MLAPQQGHSSSNTPNIDTSLPSLKPVYVTSYADFELELSRLEPHISLILVLTDEDYDNRELIDLLLVKYPELSSFEFFNFNHFSERNLKIYLTKNKDRSEMKGFFAVESDCSSGQAVFRRNMPIWKDMRYVSSFLGDDEEVGKSITCFRGPWKSACSFCFEIDGTAVIGICHPGSNGTKNPHVVISRASTMTAAEKQTACLVTCIVALKCSLIENCVVYLKLHIYLKFFKHRLFSSVDAATHSFLASIGYRISHNHYSAKNGNIPQHDMVFLTRGQVVMVVFQQFNPCFPTDKGILLYILLASSGKHILKADIFEVEELFKQFCQTKESSFREYLEILKDFSLAYPLIYEVFLLEVNIKKHLIFSAYAKMAIEWGNDYLEECTCQIQFEPIFQRFSELNGVQLRITSNSKQFYNTESIVISNKMPTLCNSSNIEYFPKTQEVPFNWPKNPLPLSASYGCKFCTKICWSSRALIVHRKIWHSRKRYLCFVCLMNFATHDDLIAHSRTHKTAGIASISPTNQRIASPSPTNQGIASPSPTNQMIASPSPVRKKIKNQIISDR